MARPMLTRLSAITPRPTQRLIPVSAAIEPVSTLDHADASLASGAPFLIVAEPALLLLAFAVGAFGGAIRNADALDAFGFGHRLIFGGVETGIRRDQAGRASQLCLMGFDRRDQQVRIA